MLFLNTFVNKVLCSGILFSFLGWHVTLARVWARKTKVFPQKYNSTSKALPNRKCGALNSCIYYTVVLFYSTGQSSSLDAAFYSIGLRSLYVDQRLWKDNTGLFYSYDGGENKNKWHFCLKASYAWASFVSHCFPLFVWEFQNWIRFNSI